MSIHAKFTSEVCRVQVELANHPSSRTKNGSVMHSRTDTDLDVEATRMRGAFPTLVKKAGPDV